ncbi:MAG: hypothetical protein RR276_07285, partial [Angelakisella sp.]
SDSDKSYRDSDKSYSDSDKSYRDSDKNDSDKNYDSIRKGDDDNISSTASTSHSTENTESVFGEVLERIVQSGKNLFEDEEADSAPSVDPLGGFAVHDSKDSDPKQKGDNDKK